jgi:hypothetical protein
MKKMKKFWRWETLRILFDETGALIDLFNHLLLHPAET